MLNIYKHGVNFDVSQGPVLVGLSIDFLDL